MRTVQDIERELVEVEDALRAIRQGAQSYTIGSRSVTKASYADLLRQRKELRAELGDATSGGCVLVGWDGR